MVKKKKAAKALAEEVPSAAPEEPRKLKKKKRPKQAAAAEAEDAVAAEPAESAAAAPAPAAKRRKRPQGAEAEAEAGDAAPAAAAAPAPAKRRKADAGAAAKGSPPADDSGPAAAGAKPDADCTVFVDGVPYVWTPDKIKEFFGECGEIREVRAPTWQDSGRLRGFAHVTFASAAAMKKALGMNGVQVGKKARYLKIEPAKSTDGAASSAPSVDLEGKRRLFVKNLPYDATEAQIAELFSSCGKVREVRVPTSFGRAKGFAYVEFVQTAALKAVFKMQPPPQLRGRVLRLDADAGAGPRAGFHYRPEAYESGFGPSQKRQRPGGGGGGGGKGGGKGGKTLSLF